MTDGQSEVCRGASEAAAAEVTSWGLRQPPEPGARPIPDERDQMSRPQRPGVGNFELRVQVGELKSQLAASNRSRDLAFEALRAVLPAPWLECLCDECLEQVTAAAWRKAEEQAADESAGEEPEEQRGEEQQQVDGAPNGLLLLERVQTLESRVMAMEQKVAELTEMPVPDVCCTSGPPLTEAEHYQAAIIAGRKVVEGEEE